MHEEWLPHKYPTEPRILRLNMKWYPLCAGSGRTHSLHSAISSTPNLDDGGLKSGVVQQKSQKQTKKIRMKMIRYGLKVLQVRRS